MTKLDRAVILDSWRKQRKSRALRALKIRRAVEKTALFLVSATVAGAGLASLYWGPF
jgi:type IV secretory pathway protease TraF